MDNLGCWKTKTNKQCVAIKQNCKFRIHPLQPCGNPVFSGFSAYHLPKNQAYVLNLATDHFRFLAHSRSLTFGRWGCGERTYNHCSGSASSSLISGSMPHQPVVSPPSGTGVTRHATALLRLSDSQQCSTHNNLLRCVQAPLFAFRRCNLASASAIFCSSVLLMM